MKHDTTTEGSLPGRNSTVDNVLAGVMSSILTRSHTFVEIDPETIFTIIFPAAESFKKGCGQLQAKVCARSTG